MNDQPPSRIFAFDHVRGLAVIFMIISHVAVIFGSQAANDTLIGHFMNDGCGTAPAAPVFMMLMGIFFLYPHDKPMLIKISRGAKIFLLGILLNVVRLVIPMSVAMIFKPDIPSGIKAFLGVNDIQLFWRLFYNLDILEFAGVAFIILAVMERFIRSSYVWAIVGIMIVIVAPSLWGTGESWGALYSFVQPLWGNTLRMLRPGDTSFPVFPWLVYPIAGIIIGKGLLSGMDGRSLLKRIFAAGIVLFALGSIVIIIGTTEQFGDYYRMFPGGTSLVLGFALVWTSFFMWLAQKDVFQKPLSKLIFWSENITLIYCVQWVLFGYSMLFIGFKNMNNEWALLALAPVYILLTYLVTLPLLRSDRFMRAFRWFTK